MCQAVASSRATRRPGVEFEALEEPPRNETHHEPSDEFWAMMELELSEHLRGIGVTREQPQALDANYRGPIGK